MTRYAVGQGIDHFHIANLAIKWIKSYKDTVQWQFKTQLRKELYWPVIAATLIALSHLSCCRNNKANMASFSCVLLKYIFFNLKDIKDFF